MSLVNKLKKGICTAGLAGLLGLLGLASGCKSSGPDKPPIPTNSPPVWSNVPTQTAYVDTPFTLDLSNYVTDPDGNFAKDGYGDQLIYVKASGQIDWFSFDSLTGEYSGTPNSSQVGTYVFTFDVTDADPYTLEPYHSPVASDTVTIVIQ